MKKIVYLIIAIITFGCSNSEDSSDNNGLPSDFEVSIESIVSDSAEISWSESFDPEGEQIKYAVHFENNQVANNLTNRNYSFPNLNPETDYSGSVTAFDPEGGTKSIDFMFSTSENLPPSEFEITSVEPLNITTNISWQESIDPEGGLVTYDLYINNQLVETGLSNLFYTIQNLSVATIYQAKIVAVDEAGKTTVVDFEFETQDGIYQGDLNLNTQASVNQFGALGYVEINGNLEMSGYVGFADVYDLSPINSIKIVRGYFDINFVGTLSSLAGLGIEHVGYSFRIRQNDGLVNLEGLESLTEVLGSFEVEQNSNLQTISGIDNLTTIGTYLQIYNNINLMSVTGFDSLNDVDTLYFSANWNLTEINAFNNVTVIVDDLNLTDNTSLSTLNGLNNVTSIGRIFIENSALTNLNTLSSLQVITVELNIQGNSMLENILGLISLEEITYLGINMYNNDIITNVDGLDNLAQVGGTIDIINNPSLVDFCALENIILTTPFNIYNNGLEPNEDLCPN